MNTLLVLGALLGATAQASARSQVPPVPAPSKVVVRLEVPAEQAPEHVCIVTRWGCTAPPGSDLQQARAGSCSPLSTVADSYFPEYEDEPHHRTHKPRANEDLRPPSKDVFSGKDTIASAMESLSRAADPHCDRRHDACLPLLRFSQRMLNKEDYDKSSITCGRGDSNTSRTVVMYLFTDTHSTISGISGLDVVGDVATLYLTVTASNTDVVQAEVIGGDYLTSTQTAIGSRERMSVTLAPRCRLSHIDIPNVPGFTMRTADAVTLTQSVLQTESRASHETKPSRCSGTSDDVLSIILPSTSEVVKKKVEVTLMSDRADKAPPITLESTWLSREPPPLLPLAFRSIEFNWSPDCLSGSWKPEVGDVPWSRACPRAVLDADAICNVEAFPVPDDKGDLPGDAICRYRCTSQGTTTLKPPFDVKFERVRMLDHKLLVLYSWTDTIRHAGQTLRSFVAPSDRKLVVDFANAQQWASRGGDQYDAIRFVSAIGSIANVDLTPIGKSEPTPWLTIPSPGATCTDRVRLAILGTRLYNEFSVSVNHGQLTLGSPSEYRTRWHPWLLLGAGALEPLNEMEDTIEKIHRGEKFVSIGVNLQMYLDNSTGTFDFEVIGQLSQTGYGRLQPMTADEISLGHVLYERVALRVMREWSLSREWQVGGGGGVSWGFPIDFSARDKIGTFRFSAIGEGNVRRSLSWQGGWVLEGAVGLRAFEHHPYFKSDFTGGTMAEQRSLWQPYLEFRLRVRFL